MGESATSPAQARATCTVPFTGRLELLFDDEMERQVTVLAGTRLTRAPGKPSVLLPSMLDVGLPQHVDHSEGPRSDVTFADALEDAHRGIDAAYHAKYDRYGLRIVGSVVGPTAHNVTNP